MKAMLASPETRRPSRPGEALLGAPSLAAVTLGVATAAAALWLGLHRLTVVATLLFGWR